MLRINDKIVLADWIPISDDSTHEWGRREYETEGLLFRGETGVWFYRTIIDQFAIYFRGKLLPFGRIYNSLYKGEQLYHYTEYEACKKHIDEFLIRTSKLLVFI